MSETQNTPQLPAVGTRLTLAGHLGTVRFVGSVRGTQGLWLGIEWDDPTRGKHDGVKDGQRYFTCSVPNSGSFIRPTASGISYGTSFLKALVAKYIELPHGTTVERVILGSSNGAIEVEAPGLDKVRGKLSNLQRLREVSLDNQAVSIGDTPGDIERTCPGIRGLDLSKNLLPSWDTISHIISELPALATLAVNHNRLTMPSDTLLFKAAFSRIKELQISSTLMTWNELLILVSNMPSLRIIEAGYNRLHSLSNSRNALSGTANALSTLQEINLDGNLLSRWSEVCFAVAPFVGLERLVLSGNQLETIDERVDNRQRLDHLKHLSLTSNHFRDIRDIDRLTLWCPELVSLTLASNPLVLDPDLGGYLRQFTIAKVPSLTILDGAMITAKERVDCELFYLSYINKHGPHDEAARLEHHPRWRELCAKHAIQDTPHKPTSPHDRQDTLSNRLFGITAHRCAAPPSTSGVEIVHTQGLKVLPTMTMRTFRMKLAKTFKLSKTEQAGLRLWLKMPDATYAEMEVADDSHDLDWWGLEDGSEIAVAAP